MCNRCTTPDGAGIEVQTIAGLYDAARACARIAAAAAHDRTVVGGPADGSALRPVPEWHPDLDRAWRDRRAQLVAALRDNAHHLRQCADAYRATDQAIADTFAELLSHRGPPTQSHPVDRGPDRPVERALDDPRRGDSGTRTDRDDARDVDRDRWVEPADCQSAAQRWLGRRDEADDTAAALAGDELRPPWRGAAADAHQVWVADHQRQWHVLAADADTVHRALAGDGRSSSVAPAPELSPTHKIPRQRAGALPEPTALLETWPGPDAHTPPPGTNTPDLSALHPAATGPDATPSREEPEPRTPPSGPVPASAAPVRQEPQAQVPAHDAMSGQEPPRSVSDTTDPRTDHRPDQRAEATPQPDSNADTSSHPPASPEPARHGETSSSAGTAGLPAAAASAAAFARADRSLHVVREIPVPPPATPPPPGSPQAPSSPALPGSPSSNPPPLPAGPVAVADRTPPAVPDLPALTAAAGDRDTTRRPRTVPGPHDSDPTQPDPPGRSGLWTDLAAPEAAEPVLIDLTATGGLGIDGPGIDDLTRTLLARLLTRHHEAITIVAPGIALARLTHDGPDPSTYHHTGTGRQIAEHADAVSLQPLTHPWHGLRWLIEQTRDRERTEHRARLDHPERTTTHSPGVLLVPAPTAAQARTQLAEAIIRAGEHRLAVIVGGQWEPGTSLRVTDNQLVVAHTTAIGSPHPDLTGHYLHPTTPSELRERLLHPDHHPNTDGASAVGAGAAGRGSGDLAVESEAHIVSASTPPAVDLAIGSDEEHPVEPHPRTPLALTVLGPVALTARLAASTGTGDAPEPHTAAAGSACARHSIDIPSVASELLAFLAAHPKGIARDTIVAALWPDTTADRPAAALHTTLSRLRKRLRDATGITAAGDVVVTTGGRWSLNTHVVTVDYWTFLEARNQTPSTPALETAVAIYAGPFAADQIGEWTHAVREATRRRYLEALHDLAELEIPTDPDRALGILETARNLEPLNEEIYRTIMRIHRYCHRPDAAAHTYRLLRTCLAAIDAEPDSPTRQLADEIASTPRGSSTRREIA